MAGATADAGVPPRTPGGGAVACQGGLARCCEAGSAWRGAAVWAKARGPACRLGHGIMQYARSGRVQCTHGRCSTQCRGMLQVAGEGGVYQIEVRINGESSGHAILIKGASSQCNAKTHVKTGHALQVLTKCHRHLGRSWGGQELQMGVSLDAKDSGEVSWTKGETCSCKFC